MVQRYSVDDLAYFPTTPNDVCGYITADGQTIEAEYANTANFAAPYNRFWLAASNTAGTARESARVTVWFVVTFRT